MNEKLSVIVPVKNEEDNIAPLILELEESLRKLPIQYDIIYVDDGSNDKTSERLFEAKRALPHLHILQHEKSRGQSAAIRTGIIKSDSMWVATIDGDAQNNPADIPKLFAQLQASASPTTTLVAGWRTQRQDSITKKVSSKVANYIRSRLLNDGTPDSGCGLKVFSRELFLKLPHFNHMHRFLPALVLREGGQVKSVPVDHRHRTLGRSSYGINNRLWSGIIDLLGVAWLISRKI